MDASIFADEMLDIMMAKRSSEKHEQPLPESVKGEIFILLTLSKKACTLQPGEISSCMATSTARIASALNNLDSKGLVHREIDKADRRRICVSLTKEGKKVALEQKQQLIDSYLGMFNRLGEQDARDLVRITRKLFLDPEE